MRVFVFCGCFYFQHMRSPSVSCLDVETSPPPLLVNDSTAFHLVPGTPPKSHRRSASCGNNASASAGKGQSSGPDMRIIRIRMDLHDGNLYRSILVSRRSLNRFTLMLIRFSESIHHHHHVVEADRTLLICLSSGDEQRQDAGRHRIGA